MCPGIPEYSRMSGSPRVCLCVPGSGYVQARSGCHPYESFTGSFEGILRILGPGASVKASPPLRANRSSGLDRMTLHGSVPAAVNVALLQSVYRVALPSSLVSDVFRLFSVGFRPVSGSVFLWAFLVHENCLVGCPAGGDIYQV